MYCSKCGNKLDNDARFCPICGEPVESVAKPHVTQQYTEPRQTYTPAPKSSFFSKFLKFVGVLALLAVAAGGMLYFFGDRFGGGNDDGGNSTIAPVTTQQPTSQPTQQPSTPIATPSGEAIVTPPPANGQQPTQLPENNPPQDSEYHWDGTVAEGFAYSTTDVPDESDFYWYAADGYVHYDQVYDFGKIFGGWKATMRYQDIGWDLGNLYIYGDEEEMTADATMEGALFMDQEGIKTENKYRLEMHGNFNDGTLTLTDNDKINLTISLFVEYDGTQYAVGEGYVNGDIAAMILLKRP